MRKLRGRPADCGQHGQTSVLDLRLSQGEELFLGLGDAEGIEAAVACWGGWVGEGWVGGGEGWECGGGGWEEEM